VLALVLMLLTMILSSMGIVREKEIGTMEQLIVTPLRSWQIIAGKLLPFALIGLVNIFIVTGIAVGWFGVPMRGSLIQLVLLTMLLLLNTLGLGLLVSTIVRTQQQAMMTSAFMVMVPMIYLSGLLFPIESMPRFLQLVTYLIPLRYYAEILRGIFLKGAGIEALWPQAAALAGFGVAFLTLASLRFQKRLE
jgi:ABC-2 type transport system permease protein